jgi:hypothetical protein
VAIDHCKRKSVTSRQESELNDLVRTNLADLGNVLDLLDRSISLPFQGSISVVRYPLGTKGANSSDKYVLLNLISLNSQFKDIHCLREALQEGIRSF